MNFMNTVITACDDTEVIGFQDMSQCYETPVSCRCQISTKLMLKNLHEAHRTYVQRQQL